MQRPLLALILICLSAGSIPFGRAQANYQPGVKPGDTISYGQVSASWSGNLNPQSPVADFLNVASVQIVVTSVNQDNVTLQQTKAYSNGTKSSLHLLYNAQSGYANATSSVVWVIARDLLAPEASYESSQAPTITRTVEKASLGIVRTVNVISQEQTLPGGYASIEEDFDQNTGVLLYFTFNLVYSNIYSVTAHLYITITQTSLWSPPVYPDFAIFANPYTAMVLKGSSVNSTISFQSLNNFQGTVSLSQTVSPIGPTMTFNQTTFTIPSGGVVNVLLNFSTSPSVLAAFYRVNITATDGSLVHSSLLNVTVTGPGYSLSPAQAYIAIPTNSSGTDTVTLTSVGRFNGTITLKAVPLTPGPVLSLNPSTITVKAGTNTTTITITTHLVPVGYYIVQVNGTGNLLQTTYIYLQVLPGPPDFTINLDPSLASFDPVTGYATTQIVLTSVNGFVGTININLFYVNGSSDTFLGLDNPTLNAGQSTSILLKILYPPISIGCCGILQVVATSGPLSHSANLSIEVLPGPDFTLTVYPDSFDLPQGGSYEVANLTVTNIGTVTGTINFQGSVTGNFYGGWAWTPNWVTLAPGETAKVLVGISINPPTIGSFNFTIRGYNIGHSHKVQLSLTVLSPSAGFTINSGPGPLAIQQGTSTAYGINLTSIDNFYASITLSASTGNSDLMVGLTARTVQLSANATITLSIDVISSTTTTTGTYHLNITAIGNGIIHTTIITIQIWAPPDFTITVAPTQLNAQPGQSYTASITLNGLHNFNGTINLATATTGSGPILSLNAQTLVLSYARSLATTTLAVSLPADATPGSAYTITITATNGTVTRQASLIVTATQSPESTGGLITPYEIPLLLLATGVAASATIVLFMRRRGQLGKPKQNMGNRQPQ